MTQRCIILGVTASIACYKALELIRAFKRRRLSVVVVLTKEVEEFIKPILFQEISENRVITSRMFELSKEWEMGHISLADRADCVVIAPATANIIAKISHGICDDMLTCLVAATKAPVLFAPAMNENMYKNRIVQENINRLKKIGYHFTGPVKGDLLCGKVGMGHIQDIDIIVKEVIALLG